MMKRIRNWFSFVWSLLKTAWKQFSEDKASRLAAAMAFYAIFALPPLAALIIGILGLVFGPQAVQHQIAATLGHVLSRQGAQTAQAILGNTMIKPSSNVVAVIISGVVLLISAIGFFTQLQDALNTVWGVEPKPGTGIWAQVKDRLPALLMVGIAAAALLSSVFVSAGINAYGKYIPILGHNAAVMQWLNFLFYFALAWVIFALIYKYLPDVKIGWREVWLGAGITAFLFAVGQFLLSLYFGLVNVASTYGTAGGLILILLWIYYSTQIFLLGAEITEAHAREHGTGIEPARDAVRVRVERGEQKPPQAQAA